MHVPCVIFDGKSEDFATEMFVIINSTPTRINKSHLVDLYERVSWAAPDKKFAAKLVERLYNEGDSPLRYKINRLGGRSKQEKWILQAELFNELHKWAAADWRSISRRDNVRRDADRYYERVRDFLKAAEKVWGEEAWGNANYMVTRPVTLKAMLRVCFDLCREDAEPADGRQKRWERRLAPWAEQRRNFRVRWLLRALSRQGPGRAGGPDPPGTGAVRRHHGEAAKGRGVVTVSRAARLRQQQEDVRCSQKQSQARSVIRNSNVSKAANPAQGPRRHHALRLPGASGASRAAARPSLATRRSHRR